MTSDNTDHSEFLANIKAGALVLLEDVDLPGGRFQRAAGVVGGDLVITEWVDKSKDGNWSSGNGIVLHRGDLPKLVAFLATKGYGPDGNPK